METRTKNLLKYLILPLILLSAVVVVANWQIRPDFLMHVHFYNVGQGDAAMIQTYVGNQIVIDGGPSDSVLSRLGRDMPFSDRTIEMVIMTHPHEDHVAGLVAILKRYKVEKVLLPDVRFSSSTYQEFLNLIDKKHIEKIYAHEGQRVWLDEATALDIYYPPAGEFVADNNYHGFTENKRNPNDVSIVGKLSFGKVRILFTGDAGEDIEKIILPKYNLDADVLKVGHQGSRFSSSSEFLQEVTPQYSVIMVGKNTYGHPTQEAMDRIIAAGSKIFRTDLDQNIEFISNGTNLYKN